MYDWDRSSTPQGVLMQSSAKSWSFLNSFIARVGLQSGEGEVQNKQKGNKKAKGENNFSKIQYGEYPMNQTEQ